MRLQGVCSGPSVHSRNRLIINRLRYRKTEFPTRALVGLRSWQAALIVRPPKQRPAFSHRLAGESRCMCLEPVPQLLVGLEFRYLNAVDSRSRFSNLPDVGFRHLANPDHSIALQSSGGQIDASFADRFIEVAAAD